MKKKISFIIPVFNVEKYVKECVQSICMQGLNWSEFEVVLINDGSTDNSESVCEELVRNNQNVILKNQKNKGQSAARNYGMSIASGEFIMFVDSDDFLNPGYLVRLMKKIDDNNLDFLGFDYELTSRRFDSDLQTEALEFVCGGAGTAIIEDYHYNNGPCWYIFKRDILNGLKFEEGRLCEDGIFTAQLLLRVKSGEIYKNKVYCYFENNLSTVKTSDVERKFKINDDMFYAVNKFKEIIDMASTKNARLRLIDRQESYTFFGLVRYLRNRRSYQELLPVLEELSSGANKGYPIRVFNGYGSFKNKLLIQIFNNKFLLSSLINFNRVFKFIK